MSFLHSPIDMQLAVITSYVGSVNIRGLGFIIPLAVSLNKLLDTWSCCWWFEMSFRLCLNADYDIWFTRQFCPWQEVLLGLDHWAMGYVEPCFPFEISCCPQVISCCPGWIKALHIEIRNNPWFISELLKLAAWKFCFSCFNLVIYVRYEWVIVVFVDMSPWSPVVSMAYCKTAVSLVC